MESNCREPINYSETPKVNSCVLGSDIQNAEIAQEGNAVERKSISIAFNVSENPFAYIRTADDVNIFISNVRKKAGEMGTKPFLQFLWIIAMFLVNECNSSDCNIASMQKCVEQACQPKLDDERSLTFEIMLDMTNNRFLQEKFCTLKAGVSSFDSIAYQKVFSDSLAFLSSVSDSDLLTNLISQDFPTQVLLQEGDSQYEFWLFPSQGNEVNVIFIGGGIFEITLPAFFFDATAMAEFGLLNNQKDLNLRTFLAENVNGLLFLAKCTRPAEHLNSAGRRRKRSDKVDDVVAKLFYDNSPRLNGLAPLTLLWDFPEWDELSLYAADDILTDDSGDLSFFEEAPEIKI